MSYGGYKRPRYDEISSQYQDSQFQQGYGPPAEYMHNQGPPIAHMGGPLSAGTGGHSLAMGPPMGSQIAPLMGGIPTHGNPLTNPKPALPSGLGTAPDGAMPLVKLRGLPFDTSVDEDCETVDIVLMKRGGRFSGEAFVVLPGMAQVNYALGKDRQYLGKRYVEVKIAAREDYYRAAANWIDDPDPVGGYPNSIPASTPGMSRYGPVSRGRRGPPIGGNSAPGPLPATGIVRLRGLPFTASQEEVAAWFNGLENLSKNVDLAEPTGSAFVEFSGPADAEVAMGRDKAMMGTRYVELFHSSKSELDLALEGS